MGMSGYAQGGASASGPSSVFYNLPFKGYQELSAWFEEFVDAIGAQMDILNARFISSGARANLIDPTYTPTTAADQNLASTTVAPVGAVSQDTMLDAMAYIALGIYPLDTNLTISQRQALVQIGWDLFKRKGTRLRLLQAASKISDGVAYGWTTPPYNFSIIVPDGTPSPGYGSWVQATGSLSETSRPWAFNAIRNTLAAATPGFVNFGVGFSQFRAGYSAAGETAFPSGATINLLAHEHFDAWSAGVPTGWSKTGTGTLTQSTSDASINWEFTGNAAVLDLSAAASGTSVGLSQTAAYANNQLTHRFQLDYKYTNAQGVSVLLVQITDANPDGSTYYWNPTTAAWSTTAYSIPVPVSSARGRYACDVTLQTASATASTKGTTSLGVAVKATSDGTATTKTTYTLYRVGLYEKYDLTAESNATGERTLWLPLVDAPGWTTATRTADTVTLLEPANATRSSYKAAGSTSAAFAYHPANSARGLLCASSWVNLLKGSNDFGTDWSVTNCTRTANATISPLVGETAASAPNLTATSTGASVTQTTGSTPTSKTYVGGVFVKKLSTDGNFTDVTIGATSTVTRAAQTFTVTQAQGWVLLPFTFAFTGSDLAALQLQISWGAASSNGQIAVASAYLYDVTGKTGVLYPPITQTAIGATGTLNAINCKAVTANTGVNVLHSLTQRTLTSVVRGTLGITIVPTFDASSQPSGVIFDVAQGAAQNRIVLRVNAGALELKRWDNAGNAWAATLTMTTSASPTASQVRWKRDTAISIRCIWDENSTMLSAGSSNASGTKPGSWAPLDTSVATIMIGQDLASANRFDGLVTGIEVDQLGAPTS